MDQLEQADGEKLSSTPPTKPLVLRSPIIVNRTRKPISDTVIELRAAREEFLGSASVLRKRKKS
jgi:hypothetical protein